MMLEKRKLIIEMATAYTSNKKATYRSVAETYSVDSATVCRYFNNHLKAIDSQLWEKVQEKKKYNRKKVADNLVQFKNKDKSFIGWIRNLFQK